MKSYDTREQWLNGFVKLATPAFAAQGLEMPEKIRVSIGWPSKGIRSKVIGECWIREASGDGHAEIFITPSLKDPARIAGVLTHELIHAVVGHAAKHGPIFKKAALSLGLEGKMTATTEGDPWRVWAVPVLDELGDYPGNVLTGQIAGGKKKQSTRLLKLECDTCGIIVRTTKKWLEGIAEQVTTAPRDDEDEEGEEELIVKPFARCINPACEGHMPYDLDGAEDEPEGE